MGLQVTISGGRSDDEPPPAAFYFDFSSPEAYLAAERVLQVLPFPAEWIPLRATQSWDAFRCAEDELVAREAIEHLAGRRGLQGVRWPPPFESEIALRAATFAKSIGRIVAFTLAAFRQAYAGGHDLGDTDVVLIAASACEMHPRAVLQAVEREATGRQLGAATALAAQRGVTAIPAVWIPDGRVLHGDAALDGAITV